jgi:hypothetical protein
MNKENTYDEVSRTDKHIYTVNSPTMGMGRERLHADGAAITDSHLLARTSCCGINV